MPSKPHPRNIKEAAANKLPRFNHYVPKFILKNFTQNKKLCIFDKHTSREFKLPSLRAMGENDFNNVKFKDAILSFEDRFTFLENKAAPIVKQIIAQKNLNCLDPMQTATLHMFSLVQFLRSKRRRLDQEILTQEIQRRWPEVQINPWKDEIANEELAKLSALDFTFSNLQELTKILTLKHSYLMIRDCADELYTSDNPFVMHNQKEFGPYGNIGIGVPHIEIYYPLSPDVVLAYACPLSMKEMEEGNQKADGAISSHFARKVLSPTGLSQNDLVDLARAKAELQRSKSNYAMIRHERLVPANAENVLYLNSLQVASSYRYLAAQSANFQLARKALKERPHWKDGLKLEIA